MSAVMEVENVSNGQQSGDHEVVSSTPRVVTAIPQDQANKTLKLRFVDLVSKGPRSPIATAFVYSDGALAGSAFAVNVGKSTDGSFYVGKIGGRYPALFAEPEILVLRDESGKVIGERVLPRDYDVKFYEHILTPFHRWQETKNPNQLITLQ